MRTHAKMDESVGPRPSRDRLDVSPSHSRGFGVRSPHAAQPAAGLVLHRASNANALSVHFFAIASEIAVLLNVMLTIDMSDDARPLARRDDPGAAGGESLQARFEAMRRRKIEAQKRVAAADEAKLKPRRSQAERDELRTKFVEQVKSYIGTPYSKKHDVEGDAKRCLDCCNLVRRAVLDLKADFGFTIGHWNQSYQFDTLPQELSPETMRPGDLIFWSATYNDPTKKPRKHDMVHVEVFLGGESGEQTIGSRSTDPSSFKGVAYHESYKSYAENCTASHGFKLYFRSIDHWLNGVCVSHCKACTWAERPTMCHATSKKYSLFHGADGGKSDEEETATDNLDACDGGGTENDENLATNGAAQEKAVECREA